MQSYVVIFESSKPAALQAQIKTYRTWGKISDNAWVVVTTKTATQIRDELFALKDIGDRIFVIRSGAVAAWSNVPASTDWLKKYL